MHAPLGAQLARERFGVEDAQILSAIEKHTLASSEMSPLDCIIYLADGLEPGRDFPDRERLWALALTDLNAATTAAIQNTVVYLERTGGEIAPSTLTVLDARRNTEGSTPSLI